MGCISSLLRRFLGDLALCDIESSQSFQLHLRSFDFNILLQLGILRLGQALSSDLCEDNLVLQLGSLDSKRSFGCGLVLSSLSLKNSCVGLNLGNLLLGKPFVFLLTDLSLTASLGGIDSGFARGRLVGLTGKEGEVLRPRWILEVLDIGVVTGKIS